MTINSNKGVLLIAFNNDVLDYGKMAVMCATRVKQFLKVPICLVTNENTWKSIPKTHKSLFDFKKIDKPKNGGTREFGSLGSSRYFNKNRSDMYDLTPFDETIAIDVDYIITSTHLNNLWGSSKEVMCYNTIQTIGSVHEEPSDIYMSSTSLRMLWATVTYFRKSQKSKLFFERVKFIRENYDYYVHLYRLTSDLYRNDFAFTIANNQLSNNSTKPENSFVGFIPGKLITANIGSVLKQISVDAIAVKTDVTHVLFKEDVHFIEKANLLDVYDEVTKCQKDL